MAASHLLEGVDFIETEEDAKAVEAATLKIQSTFRGKKIRSKLGGSAAPTPTTKAAADEQSPKAAQSAQRDQQPPQAAAAAAAETACRSAGSAACDSERLAEGLSKKVAEMQVNEKGESRADTCGGPEGGASQTPAAMEVAEAERAATKIQAGFKGYKTRKELEGKLGGAGQQQAEQANK